MAGVRFEVQQDAVLHELDRLARGPAGDAVFQMESALLSYFARTQAQVHIITGYLKSTGHTETHFDGETWEGTAAYARHPGIFELARGNKGGEHAHPPGSHYFFSGADEYLDGVRRAMQGFLAGD